MKAITFKILDVQFSLRIENQGYFEIMTTKGVFGIKHFQKMQFKKYIILNHN